MKQEVLLKSRAKVCLNLIQHYRKKVRKQKCSKSLLWYLLRQFLKRERNLSLKLNLKRKRKFLKKQRKSQRLGYSGNLNNQSHFLLAKMEVQLSLVEAHRNNLARVAFLVVMENPLKALKQAFLVKVLSAAVLEVACSEPSPKKKTKKKRLQILFKVQDSENLQLDCLDNNKQDHYLDLIKAVYLLNQLKRVENKRVYSKLNPIFLSHKNQLKQSSKDQMMSHNKQTNHHLMLLKVLIFSSNPLLVNKYLSIKMKNSLAKRLRSLELERPSRWIRVLHK